MDKEDALKVIVQCAKLYEENLENKRVLFISQISKGSINIIECNFQKGNFMHLTGVINNGISANQFYDKCINRKLSLEDFDLKDDGTTVIKLEVLPRIMKIHKTAKMIGDLNAQKSTLCVEKLAGGISACLGLSKKGGNFVPVSTLKVDMRDLVHRSERIIAIFTKKIGARLYSHITYAANGVELNEEIYYQVMQMIDMDNLTRDFAEPEKLSNSIIDIIDKRINQEA